MKISQLSTTERNNIANPTGTIVFNTTTNTFEKHNGTSWETFSSGNSIGTSTITITAGGTTNIPITSDLTRAIFVDVQTTNAITHTIVLPNQTYNVYFHIQFKFLSVSQNVTIVVTTTNNTVINTITGNPSIGVQSYPKFEYVGNGNNYNNNLFVTPSALGSNLSTAPTVNIAKSLLGLSNAVDSTVLFDTFGKINPNVMPTFLIEDFIQSATGSAIPMSSSVASGGSLATEIPENQPNWNSGTPKGRLGQASIRITNGANSRSALSTALNFRLFSNHVFNAGAEWSIVGGQINFTNDPTLMSVGFFDNFALSIPNSGVYFRPPRVGETNFLKCVIRTATTEVLILDSTIAYDSTSRRFVKTQITWDGSSLIFDCADENIISQNIVPNVTTAYPLLVAANLGFGGYNVRNGTGTTMIARNLNIDKVYYTIKTNFINF